MNRISLDQEKEQLCFEMNGGTTFRYFRYKLCQDEYHISNHSLSQLKGFEQKEIRRMAKQGINGKKIVIDEFITKGEKV